MQMCQDHWTRLRAKVDEAGLGALVATNGEDAASRLVSELTDERTTVDNFEPLMGAHMAIVGNAVSIAGPAVLVQDGCPLCWLTDEHARTCTNPDCTTVNYDHWLDRAVEDQVERWQELSA